MFTQRLVEKEIQRKCYVVGLLAFILLLLCGQVLFENYKKNEQVSASFMAQNTVRRIQSQMERYETCADYLGNVIEAEGSLDEERFSQLASMFTNEGGVIRAFELAPKGVVQDIYPTHANTEAFGLNMLKDHERKYEANLAKESGKYTLGGPFELKQGGIGALLFNPVYQMNTSGTEEFWGFVILVIDWDKFMKSIDLEELSDASYAFDIWKKDGDTGERKTIISGQKTMPRGYVTISCTIPNDTWYVDIVPVKGWVPLFTKVLGGVFCYILSLMVATYFYMILSKRSREKQYAENLQCAAKQAQEASAAKTRFLFNMSHDIRTPMNAIMGFTELLEKNLGDQKKARDYIAKIKSSSELLLTIINQVLEMARIESGKSSLNIESSDLRAMFQSVNTVLEADMQKKQIHYSYHTEVTHTYVLCDRTKLEEICLNIVGNAVKYTPSGHTIHVDIRELPSEDVKKAKYRFTCEDTGIGMSADYLPHIFDEFSREHTTTENKVVGTGLGLPIVKSIIEQMGGTIAVESQQGVGSKFTIELALTLADPKTKAAETEGHPQGETKKLEGHRILLAEDNDLNAEIALELLTDEGLQVERATNGQACYQMLLQAADDYYDLILMDIQMPVMNGYDATRKIRAIADPKKAEIPIIAMTANAFAEDKQAALEAGMNDHVAKPIDLTVLLPTILRYLKMDR